MSMAQQWFPVADPLALAIRLLLICVLRGLLVVTLPASFGAISNGSCAVSSLPSALVYQRELHSATRSSRKIFDLNDPLPPVGVGRYWNAARVPRCLPGTYYFIMSSPGPDFPILSVSDHDSSAICGVLAAPGPSRTKCPDLYPFPTSLISLSREEPLPFRYYY